MAYVWEDVGVFNDTDTYTFEDGYLYAAMADDSSSRVYYGLGFGFPLLVRYYSLIGNKGRLIGTVSVSANLGTGRAYNIRLRRMKISSSATWEVVGIFGGTQTYTFESGYLYGVANTDLSSGTQAYNGDAFGVPVLMARAAYTLVNNTGMLTGTKTTNGRNMELIRLRLNTPPTLTLSSPANNQAIMDGKTYTISGSATDHDNGDVVTIKYKINSGTPRAINSSVSNGSTAIPFSKILTFRNKRLWDGSTDVVGYDLAEGTNHTLTVWAEDDKGGKSPETTRTFTVVWNRPPVISGQDKNLGNISSPPSESFSVTDPEGQSFTIEYYLDNQRFNSFSGVSGQTYTVTISKDKWLRTSLKQHQLKIRAIDNQGAYSERTFTFTRTDDRIEFTLNYSNASVKNFFTTNQKANRILVTMDAVIPQGAQLLVEACNNAYDTNPTWENITSQVQAKRGYQFTNTTSTSGKWGINIHFKILKGTATDTVILNGFGGAFD